MIRADFDPVGYDRRQRRTGWLRERLGKHRQRALRRLGQQRVGALVGSVPPRGRPEDAREGRQAVKADGAVAGDGRHAGFPVGHDQRRAEQRSEGRIGTEAGEVLVLVDLARRADGTRPGGLEEPQDAVDGRRPVAGDALPSALQHGVGLIPIEDGGNAPRFRCFRHGGSERFQRVAFARRGADLGRVPTLGRDVGEEQRNGDRGPAPVAPREVRPHRAGGEKPDGDFGVVAQVLDRVALRERGGQRHADGEDAEATEH